MRLKFAIASFALLTLSLFFAQGASAQSPHLTAFATAMHANSGLTTAGCAFFGTPATTAVPARPASKPAKQQDESEKQSTEQVSLANAGRGTIVGLWSVQFISEGNDGIPDGTVIDQGYATWHADGTEIMNSGRPPASGNFCMGVWKLTGRLSYKLNHVTLSWDPTGTTFIGPGSIHESVTLDHSGMTYSGTFTIDQFDTNGNLLAHLQGNISATRITVD